MHSSERCDHENLASTTRPARAASRRTASPRTAAATWRAACAACPTGSSGVAAARTAAVTGLSARRARRACGPCRTSVRPTTTTTTGLPGAADPASSTGVGDISGGEAATRPAATTTVDRAATGLPWTAAPGQRARPATAAVLRDPADTVVAAALRPATARLVDGLGAAPRLATGTAGRACGTCRSRTPAPTAKESLTAAAALPAAERGKVGTKR